MNTTSVPGSSLLPESTDLFTAGHLAIIAILALLVIAGLVWGVRNARARHTAERELTEHNAAVVQEQADTPSPAPRVPAPQAPSEPLFDPLPDLSPRQEAPAPPPVTVDALSEEPATTAAEAAPAITATPDASPDAGEHNGPLLADGPVTQLKGLGAKLATRLNGLGITTIGQIAALNDDEAAALDARLGPFTGRMARDRWQEQARFLAAGDIKGFEAVFGRL